MTRSKIEVLAKVGTTRVGRRLLTPVLALSPKGLRVAVKEHTELSYWRDRVQAEKQLSNSHYEFFYTTLFELSLEDYRGRRILDIGCGPRGSLEWANTASERVGLDPLVDEYRAHGIDRHQMSYVCAPSEAIPFPDEYFDFVTSFNSLDHVDSFDKTMSEVRRVLKQNGRFLLIVEVNHRPTLTEPVSLHHDALKELLLVDYLDLSWRCYDMPVDVHDIYGTVRSGTPRPPSPSPTRPAIVVTSLRKRDVRQ